MAGPNAGRAFAQNVDRLVRRSTIVNNGDDIRRSITLCLLEQRPCVLELGSNIALTSGITIPGGLKAFSIDGAQRFKLVVSGDLPFLFYAQGAELNNGCPVEISNVEILVKEGSTLTTAFVLEQFSASFAASAIIPYLSVSNVVVDASAASCTNLFGHGNVFDAGTRNARVFASNLYLYNVSNVLAVDDNNARWVMSSIDGVLLLPGVGGTTIGAGAASARFEGTISNVLGDNVTISIGDNSRVAFISCDTSDVVGNAGVNTLLRVRGFSSRTVGPNEVDLDNISGGGGGGTTVTAATIVVPYGAQEQTVTVVDASCTAASNVIVGWGATLPTDENQPAASNVTFSAVPAAGSLAVTVSDNGVDNVGGTYKILYTLG
jgi:hypothetical protein